MRRYRFTTIFAGKVGEWREMKEEALEDALAADVAERDERGEIDLDLGVWIDECEAGQEPSALSEWELWACASRTLKEHGPDALLFVRKRIFELAKKRDVAGMQAWQAIAARVKKLSCRESELQ